MADLLQHVLEAYSFTAPRVALLEEQIQGHVQSLTDEHVSRLETLHRHTHN